MHTWASGQLAVLYCLALCLPAAEGAKPPQPPRTFFVTRSLTHEKLLPYLRAARPEIVQIGNYGAMFHGFADDEKSTGWPMRLPVAGEREALKYQRQLNAEVHQLGLTVVGHFRLTKVMGNWKEQNGFVDYYKHRWPQELLGPRPADDLRELLQRDASGEPIQLGRSGRDQLALCLSSPHARQMFKQMLKVAVDQDVDGVITTFNYRFGCACPYCQKAFKDWLRQQLTPEQIQAKLGIKKLEAHKFESIPARIPGYPDPEEATELDRLAMRWGAVHFKQKFDEIFLDYGRSLKKDLLVAQWNHLSHVSLQEERMFLPLAMYARGEDYLWYSGGAAFVGKNLNLSEGKAGDAWLSSLYVRELSGDKPFVIGKYDRTRMAASMAEGYATGGIGMGRYMRFEEPAGFEVLARYTNFMHRRRDLYETAVPFADAALVIPRESALRGKPAGMNRFRDLGQALVERQALIDLVADERLTAPRLAKYPAVILTDPALGEEPLAALQKYASAGGQVFLAAEPAAGEIKIADALRLGQPPPAAATAIVNELRQRGGTAIKAPWTVRAAAYQQAGQIVLHLVNYNRQPGAPEANRTGPETERPQAVDSIAVNLRLPTGCAAKAVTLYRPDHEQPAPLSFQAERGRVAFTVPRLLVYGVVAVQMKEPNP